MARRSAGPSFSLDIASLTGLLLAFGGIIGGLMLEGGTIADIAQATGALIVFGGTIGAVMVTTPPGTLLGAAAKLKLVFFQTRYSPRDVIEQILEFAVRARRNGIVSLEAEIDRISDPFLQKALSLGVDGTDIQELRSIMSIELDAEERKGKAEAKVYEAAGGYAPTIGIIGAVLGLIQVMKHLDDIDLVGKGIAVAFVATVYGVASANLFFLPAGNKLKARVEESIRIKELMLEGVTSIIQGLHPQVIERKLEAFVNEKGSSHAQPSGARQEYAAAQER